MNSAIVDRLLGCLAELDAQGESIAAAHVDAALHELTHKEGSVQESSEMDANRTE